MPFSPFSDIASVSSVDAHASTSSSSSSSSSSTSPKNSTSTRRRKSPRSRLPSVLCAAQSPSTAGTPTATPPRISLDTATLTAHHLVAADDLIVRIFDDPRQRLRVRTLGHATHTHDNAYSRADHAQFKSRFRAAFRGGIMNTVHDMQDTAREFTRRMQDLGLVERDEETSLAFSNLSLRYAQLKYHSTRVQMSHVVINNKMQSRILATSDIPKGVLIHELNGLMSADSVDFGFTSAAGPRDGQAGNRKRKRQLRPQFNMFSVIRKSPEQCGPGHADRLLIGPARFVNHSCRPNCRLRPFRRTNSWGIETSRDILAGEEITVSYGKEYFGPGECACASCAARRTATPLPVVHAQARDPDREGAASTSGDEDGDPENIRIPYPSTPAEPSASGSEDSARPRKRTRTRV